MSELYTTSRLRTWRDCARKEFYKYALGIQTPQTPAMAFGTAAHKALEAWYLAWQLGGDRLVAALDCINALDYVDDVDRIRLRVLIAAYDARWGGEDWEILGVEVEFSYWLGDVHIGGKIDALVRERATGRAWVLEHKTSTADTTPGAPYWDKLGLDVQVSIYVDGARAGLDVDVAGCIYDVIKRPLHELKLATPVEARKYTVGKGCKLCGGKLTGGVQGTGTSTATSDGRCAACKGSGWRLDENGEPEAPRLHSHQRERDETLDEYADRVTNEVASRVDEFLVRSSIMRLDHELPTRRQELLDTITAMRTLAALELHPPNHNNCTHGRETCAFFDACVGRQSIDDQYVYPRGRAHPELEHRGSTLRRPFSNGNPDTE